MRRAGPVRQGRPRAGALHQTARRLAVGATRPRRPPQPDARTRAGGRPADLRAGRDRRRRPATRRGRRPGRRDHAALGTGHPARGRRRDPGGAVRRRRRRLRSVRRRHARKGKGRTGIHRRSQAAGAGRPDRRGVDRGGRRRRRAGRFPGGTAGRRQRAGSQAGPAVRAARPHPQVRRRHRRRAGLGARVAGATRPTRRLRGGSERAGRPRRGARPRIVRGRSGFSAPSGARPPNGWPRRSPPSCPGWRWPTRSSAST